jgi:hypothetical protein
MFKTTIHGPQWWSLMNWLQPPTDRPHQCAICGSKYNLGMEPVTYKAFCEFHAHMTTLGRTVALGCLQTGHKITPEEWEPMRLNSYDRDTLIPHMSDEVLAQNLELTLKNCSPMRGAPAGTYDEALQLYGYELLKRLKARIQAKEND